MALTGEREISPEGWVRDQTEKILATGTTEGVEVFDRPIVLVTIRGANPHVELQDGTVTKEYDARELSGDERSEWWERSVAAYPPYAEYQEKTDRQIPVFVLEPREG